MRRIRRLLQGRSKGLTLVEVIIAIALMGIIAVAFFGGLSNALLAFHFADVQTTAESLARSEMERVKEAPYEDYVTGSPPDYIKEDEPSDFYEGYYVWLSALPIDPSTNQVIVDEDGNFREGYTEDLGIQQITVGIHYQGGAEPRLVASLVGYKRK